MVCTAPLAQVVSLSSQENSTCIQYREQWAGVVLNTRDSMNLT